MWLSRLERPAFGALWAFLLSPVIAQGWPLATAYALLAWYVSKVATYATIYGAFATAPISWTGVSSTRSGALLPPGRCRSRRDAREAEKGRGDLELVRGREIARPGSDPFPLQETPDDPD